MKYNEIWCLGTFSVSELWGIKSSFPFITSTQGYKRNTVVGNDAVLVSKELANSNYKVTCCLIDPTEEDFAYAAESLSKCTVVSNVIGAGGLTQSLCLEDAAGLRTWVFSRTPSNFTKGNHLIKGDLIYADYYPEIQTYVNIELSQHVTAGVPIYLNLSEIDTLCQSKVNASWRPYIVQASAPTLNSSEAYIAAKSLLTEYCAQIAIVTRGVRGAVISTQNSLNEGVPTNIMVDHSVLGSGAIFSACVIRNLDNFDVRDAEFIQAVVDDAAQRIPSEMP
jgi:hypothetical protein